MSMTLEQVRDWLLSRSQDGHMQRSVYVSDYQLREMADTITAHLTQPAQSVSVSETDIADWADRHDLSFGGSKTDARDAFEDARTFTAALQEKGNG